MELKTKELHYRYWLGILAAITIGALTVHWSEVKDLAQLLSFGLSLASIVLAAIAIFQSMLANSSFTSVTTSMINSSSEVRSAAQEVKGLTHSLLERTQEIPEAIGEIATRFDAALNGRILPEGRTSTAPDLTDLVLARLTKGTLIALYICIYSFQKQKAFDAKLFIGDRGNAKYIQGFIAALWSTGIMDMTFDGGGFLVNDLGRIDADRVVAAVKNADDPFFVQRRIAVEAFFGGETLDNLAKSS